MSHIVLIMGVDGSGKSSLTELLQKKLQKKGIPHVVVWASLRPVLMKPFIVVAKYLMVRNHNKFDDYETHINAKRAGMKKLSWTRHIYLFVTLIDFMPQVFFKVYLPKLMGKLVICDRYYHDLVLDYGVTTQANIDKTMMLLRYANKIFPNPDIDYLLDVPSEVSFSRKDDIPSLEYLEERSEIYHKFADSLGSAVLDGTKSLEENSDRILKDILELPKIKNRVY